MATSLTLDTSRSGDGELVLTGTGDSTAVNALFAHAEHKPK
jgi:hypothetical protein